jgi:hypothetical protein
MEEVRGENEQRSKMEDLALYRQFFQVEDARLRYDRTRTMEHRFVLPSVDSSTCTDNTPLI